MYQPQRRRHEHLVALNITEKALVRHEHLLPHRHEMTRARWTQTWLRRLNARIGHLGPLKTLAILPQMRACLAAANFPPLATQEELESASDKTQRRQTLVQSPSLDLVYRLRRHQVYQHMCCGREHFPKSVQLVSIRLSVTSTRICFKIPSSRRRLQGTSPLYCDRRV